MTSKIAIAITASLALSGCAYNRINEWRQVELENIVKIVECELFAAFQNFETELNADPLDNKWDMKTDLDLTLVSRVDADGNLKWAIPINYSATPSLGGYAQDTVVAHVTFTTDLAAVKAQRRLAPFCKPSESDPSGTGLGLAAWVKTTFFALGPEKHGGLTYTKDFEFRVAAGARLGYVLAPVALDVGAGGQVTHTNRMVVGVSPNAGPPKPLKVVIVGREGGKAVPEEVSKRNRALNNPNLINQMNRQTPVYIQPGARR